MKFCQKCGKEIMDEAVICTNCGCQVGNTSLDTVDSGSFGWAVLGFFVPIVGLILYLVWKNTKPLSAKKAGTGALVGVIVNIVISIIYGAVIGALIGGSMYY